MLVDAIYGFLVATIRENGNEQLMSFADGSVRRCSPRTPVYVRTGGWANFGNQHDYGILDASGTVLDGMIRKLHLNTHGSCELDELVGIFEPFYGSAAVAEALRAAEWWSFLSLGDANDLRITDAGRVWAEAEPSRLADRERVARVSERRRNEPTFSIGANYGVINVAKTIRGNQTAINSGRPRDDELLAALDGVLKIKEIPWRSSQLRDVRAEIQAAVVEREAHRPALKGAISKLFRVCGDLAIKIAGNVIFDTLKSYLP